MTPETLKYEGQVLQLSNHTLSIYNMVLSVIIIVSLIMVLYKKVVGAYVFIAMQVVNCIVLSVVGASDVTSNIVVSIVMCGIFVGLLHLRKEGKSGWDVLRNKDIANI